MATPPRARPVLAGIGALLLAGPALGAAPPGQVEVPLPWTIVIEEAASADGCGAVAFLQVTPPPGALRTEVAIFDTNPRVNTTFTLVGPPGRNDTETIVNRVVVAPPGTNRWGLSSASAADPSGCGGLAGGFLNPSRWRVSRAVAYVSCFLGPPPGGGQSPAERTVRRAMETEAQACARRKQDRRRAYEALNAGLNVSAASAAVSTVAFRRYRRQIAGQIAARWVRNSLVREAVGAEFLSPGVAIATAASLVDGLATASELGGLLSVSGAAATGMVALFDPPDPAWRTVPVVTRTLPAAATALPGRLPGRARAGLAPLLDSRSRMVDLNVAFVTAMNRAGNANAQRDAGILSAQLGAAAGFADQIAAELARQPALARAATGPLRTTLTPALWRGVLTPERARPLLAQVRREPLAPRGLAIVGRAGAPVAELRDLARGAVGRASRARLVGDPLAQMTRDAAALAGQAPRWRALAAELRR
ncbi:MAG: hypothetical protein MUE51_07515 [Thermoleophilia bacterium]|jgi:hypothetical protein|nr:hypothetical protein [Thermoleophilia bacterium]